MVLGLRLVSAWHSQKAVQLLLSQVFVGFKLLKTIELALGEPAVEAPADIFHQQGRACSGKRRVKVMTSRSG